MNPWDQYVQEYDFVIATSIEYVCTEIFPEIFSTNYFDYFERYYVDYTKD